MRIAAAALLILASGLGAAAVPEHETSRFVDRVVYPRAESIGVAPRDMTALDADDRLRIEWDGFRARIPGYWTGFLDERSGMPTLVRGSGLRWFASDSPFAGDPVALEDAVRRFLDEQRAWLGDWTGRFEIDREATRRLQRGHEQIVLRQVVDGVRVENARFDFHVKDGNLVMFGASQWAPVGISGIPSVSLDEAREVVRMHLGDVLDTLVQHARPELVLRAVDADRGAIETTVWHGPRGQGIDHVLLWRFRRVEPAGAAVWVAEVDAHDGSLHAFYDDTEYATTRGGVFPFSNDGDCADGGCEIARLPMPFSFATEVDQDAMVTDAYGNLECSEPGAGFAVELSGPYVHIHDACGAFDENGTCEAGADLGIKAGENCSVDPLRSAGNTAAARTAFYHVNRAAQAARFYDPANAWLQSTVVVNVNDENTCNAFWNGEITMLREGDGCGNMGEIRGILVHEWGHGHDHNDGGGSDSPSEAYADVMALFAGRDSCIARGWYNAGGTCEGWGNGCLTCTGVRDLDWAAREWGTPSTIPGFVATQCPSSPGSTPCSRQPHCEGYVVGETMYDLAARDLPASGIDQDTAWQIAERLWYVSRQGSGGNMYFCIFPNVYSCGATSLHQRLLAVDDDDGDLSNGTPHAAAIFAAFDRHGLACGTSTDPENQSTSSCPPIAVPVLSVQETPTGTELGWTTVANAAEYRVYGNEIGCNRQQTPLASLSPAESTFLDADTDPELPRYYRIEALGSNPACSGPVSNCAETFTGARLQIVSHRFVETGTVNGFPDPGETVRIPITLFNSGVEAAVETQGTLTIVDPAQGTVLDGQATWSGPAASEGAESDEPHFEVELADTVACGDVVAFDLQISAANATTQSERFGVQLGDKQRDFTEDEDLVVPSDPSESFESTIVIDQEWTIGELDVTINVTQPNEEDLIVELTSPQGTTVRLHDQSTLGFGIHERYDLTREPDGPGTMDDFVGGSTSGTWTLTVQDVGNASSGDSILTDWTLHVTVNEGFDCVPAACEEPPPATAPTLTLTRVFDGASYDLGFTWTPVPGVAGYRVLQSSDPSFVTDVTVLAEPDATETTFVMDEPTSPDLLFFEVRGLNSCGEEGP